jgi:NAD(P)H-dependent FMN reductase
MADEALNILAVIGSRHQTSITRVVVNHAADELRAAGCAVDVLDLDLEPLPLYDPAAEDQPYFAPLQTRVDHADVFILGTPDYPAVSAAR